MVRFAWLALVSVAACAAVPAEQVRSERGYAGTVQKVVRVVRQSADLPGIGLLGKLGSALAPALRHNAETLQYIVRTPTGQIMAQSDQEFPVGECVHVIPQTDRSGPAFRYGEARIVPCH